ncbi:MAG: Putative ATPase, AFG1-like [uncultured Caballeronia sp.]|nr:MAG: Putative ATPase, AFG1-like [uncultured Caballeronia sp.]
MIEETDVVGALEDRSIVPDSSQRQAISALVLSLDARPWRKWVGKSRARQGVYCYGLPGRGKSLIVDTVYGLANCQKRRIHFHEFLREMNRRLVMEARGDDRLGSVARAWLDGVELLCFDEFHVHDIADAFLIGRFLDTALELGTRIVLTSNYAPQGLLPNPEFHERIQPMIDRIERHFTLIHFDGALDYRFTGLQTALPRFFSPLDAATADKLRTVFLRFENNDAVYEQSLTIAGRRLNVRAAGRLALWADFAELCVGNRSYLDYLALVERWPCLVIDQLTHGLLTNSQTLQRFIWLVDIFYDHKRALFIASDVPVETALDGLEGAHDLSRTLSRLAEMQSRSYPDPLDRLPNHTEVTICPS